MRICVIGDPHGNLEKIKNIKLEKEKIDLILLTGDLGKADYARKLYFENLKRKEKGLAELEETKEDIKKIINEIYNSSMIILNYLSKIAPVYTIAGNVWENDNNIKKDEKNFGIKLPYLHKNIRKNKNMYLIKNRLRIFNNIRIGFLEYFIDVNWIKTFKPKNYNKELKLAKKQTEKVKKILEKWKKIDVLVCHQPPYGILDKVGKKYNPPKFWIGKNAGSKTILNYIKKYKPKYVFCGHIHEAEGKAKLNTTQIYNLGIAGHKIIEIN